MQGKIKRVMSGKGYGFITTEGSDKDIFFHATNLKGITFDELSEDMAVEFEVQEGKKGQEAVNVSVAS